MVASNPNPNGWTWVFGKHNKQHCKPTDDLFIEDMEKIATSFYVSDFPILWMLRTFGRNSNLIDALLRRLLRTNDQNKLDECDLIKVEDASTVVMVKVKEIDTISNTYHVCHNKGFDDIKIHHIGPIYNNDVVTSRGNEDVPFSTDLVKDNHTVTLKDMAADEMIEEGGALGYDVKGCTKYLRYLDYVLDKLGFGIKWRNWIKVGLVSARTSILINGSPTLEFSLKKKGLRQGDPLSPFLFIIVMEGLHMALNDGLAANMFHGVKVGSP
ncbi:putative RNA-directed DNA polymerase, eukaryota, reverse transcriptase zinc-binding domain protein, partial [Tanacetum coccineum]